MSDQTLCDNSYITFSSLSSYNGIGHAFSTRAGGNLAFGRGDDQEKVRENYRRLCEAAQLNIEGLVLSNQIHEATVRQVTCDDWGKGIFRKNDIVGVDALVTNVPGTALTTFYADCVPLYFYDPVNHAIGLAHAGWRGTVKKIAAATVTEMEKAYGTRQADLIAVIGPSIHQCCFEVDAPVAEEFEKNLPFVTGSLYEKVYPDKPGKTYIDMQSINKTIMIEAGVLPEHIEVSLFCTKCRSDLFYSHRVMGEKRGSMAALLQLR